MWPLPHVTRAWSLGWHYWDVEELVGGGKSLGWCVFLKELWNSRPFSSSFLLSGHGCKCICSAMSNDSQQARKRRHQSWTRTSTLRSKWTFSLNRWAVLGLVLGDRRQANETKHPRNTRRLKEEPSFSFTECWAYCSQKYKWYNYALGIFLGCFCWVPFTFHLLPGGQLI